MNDARISNIMKALEICSTMKGCIECPYDRFPNCVNVLCAHTLMLLTPHILTLEEVKRLGFNDVVYVDQRIMILPAIILGADDKALTALTVHFSETGGKLDYDSYGKTWRCWDSCPTAEQMKEVPW